MSKKNKSAGVYNTTSSSTSLPLNISWPSTINYNVKNMSIGFDHASGLDYYSSWTWTIPGFHDRKILKKKQRRDIDKFIKKWESKNSIKYDYDTVRWLDSNGFSFKSSSGPLSPPTGIITYMDFLGPYNGGNNSNNP